MNIRKFGAIMLISTSAVLYSCQIGNVQNDMGAMTAQETDFIQVSESNGDQQLTYPGTIEGSVNVDVKAQVTGYLEAVFVKEGDYVQKGQRLFKIKSDVFTEQIRNSEAALKSAEAGRANARLEVEKLRPLVEGKVVSDIQLKTAQASYEAASAQVAQAKAALGSSRINAAFSLITAPVSGYIGRIPNRIGNLVTPSDATPLTTLSDIGTIYVYFSMSEAAFISFSRDSNRIVGGKPSVELILADGSVYNHKGTLESGSGNIDRSTGSMAMKAVFTNPDKLLRAGGTGRIIIHRSLPGVLSIPKTSVKDIQDRLFVFRLADSNKVRMVPVEPAANTETNFFIKGGLKPGDKIAINRIDALNDGMEVIPKIVGNATH